MVFTCCLPCLLGSRPDTNCLIAIPTVPHDPTAKMKLFSPLNLLALKWIPFEKLASQSIQLLESLLSCLHIKSFLWLPHPVGSSYSMGPSPSTYFPSPSPLSLMGCPTGLPTSAPLRTLSQFISWWQPEGFIRSQMSGCHCPSSNSEGCPDVLPVSCTPVTWALSPVSPPLLSSLSHSLFPSQRLMNTARVTVISWKLVTERLSWGCCLKSMSCCREKIVQGRECKGHLLKTEALCFW